jgi:hypothetical protein
MGKRTGADGYEDILGREKPAKGERAALVPYLESDEALLLRQQAEGVGEADGRMLLQGVVVVLVTDRKIVAGRTSGGFRPHWEVFALPFGHLEPGVVAGGALGADVSIPTSGRRSYFVRSAETESATRLADSLGEALRAYRRDRMGLSDL